jgi:thiol-disulfide isomerase/thioredoxin
MARLIVLIIAFLFVGQAQGLQVRDRKKIRVLNFDQLEPYLHFRNDTVYLVNFWATWCAPCIAELPAIKAIENKYSDKKFKVLLVSLDMPRQLDSRLIPFVLSNQITSDVFLLDDPNQNRWIDKVSREWSGEIPFTVIYGKDFRDSYTQSFSYQTLDSIVNRKIKLP